MVKPNGVVEAAIPGLADHHQQNAFVAHVRARLGGFDVITDTLTGISFNWRSWGDADADVTRSVIECAYGYAAGETAALKRLVSA